MSWKWEYLFYEPNNNVEQNKTKIKNSELKTMLDKGYYQLVDFLKEKYGEVPFDYFTSPNCVSKNAKNSRTKDGLYIHHIDEDKAILLSTKEYAIKNPFEYQKAHRLVYCNLLEHLILHIKIMENPSTLKNVNESVGIGGVFAFMIPELNDIYSGISYKQEWKINCLNVVVDLKEEYLSVLEHLMINFPEFPLEMYLTSLNDRFGGWNSNNNKKLYKQIKQIFNSIN